MSRKERIRAVLERFVIHLWVTALVILAVRHFVPVPSAEAARPNQGPGWCSPSLPAAAGDCRWHPDDLTLTVPAPDQIDAAFYLARPFSHGPCSPIPQDLSRDFASVLGACGAELLHDVGDLDLCVPGPDKGRVYRVPAGEISPCATIVGGPYGDNGDPIAGQPTPPFLTIYPALDFTDELLDFVELRKKYNSAYAALAQLEGSAFSGWLVLPVHGLDIPVSSLPAAQHLLTRAAAAVGLQPVPNPVLLDVAGLALCPTPQAMPRILSEMDAVGLRPIGHGVAPKLLPAGMLGILPLTRRGETVAQVLSVRLTLSSSECATLQSVRPKELPLLLADSLALADHGAVPTALLLHRADDTVDDAAMETLLAELDVLPGNLLVTVFQQSSAGPLSSGTNGPRVLDMGAAIHEDSLFPSAVMPHGWLVQCYQLATGTMTCTPRLLAGYFGEALPVAGGHCNACSFLPATLDDVLRLP